MHDLLTLCVVRCQVKSELERVGDGQNAGNTAGEYGIVTHVSFTVTVQ